MKKLFWVITILLVIFSLSVAQDSQKALEQASYDIVVMSEDDLIEGED